jgi:hypothetical protein
MGVFPKVCGCLSLFGRTIFPRRNYGASTILPGPGFLWCQLILCGKIYGDFK